MSGFFKERGAQSGGLCLSSVAVVLLHETGPFKQLIFSWVLFAKDSRNVTAFFLCSVCRTGWAT